MCNEHRGFFGMPFARFGKGFCHGGPWEASKETKIKSLEAMKARIEDFLKYIDKQIEEIQKEKA